MRDLPLPVKIIINIILFIIYWFVLNFLSWIIIGIVSLTWLYNIDDFNDSFFEKVSLVMLLLNFITIYYRKYFYVMKLDKTSNNSEKANTNNEEISL
jgi:hypothetical protein